MRQRKRILSGAELAELERSVGIEPSVENRVLTIRRERSRWVENVRSLPEEGQVILAIIAVGLTVLVIVAAIMSLSAFLPGGPPAQHSCVMHGGTFKVVVGNDDTEWSGMVVCHDGSSYTN